MKELRMGHKGLAGPAWLFAILIVQAIVSGCFFRYPEVGPAKFSPDGDLIAFGKFHGIADNNLIQAKSDGSLRAQITYENGLCLLPQYSSDGKYLLYIFQPTSGGSQLVRRSIQSGETQALAAVNGPVVSWHLSKDGNRAIVCLLRDYETEIGVFDFPTNHYTTLQKSNRGRTLSGYFSTDPYFVTNDTVIYSWWNTDSRTGQTNLVMYDIKNKTASNLYSMNDWFYVRDVGFGSALLIREQTFDSPDEWLVYNLATNQIVARYDPTIYTYHGLFWGGPNTMLAVSSKDYNYAFDTIYAIDLDKGSRRTLYKGSKRIKWLSLSKDGNKAIFLALDSRNSDLGTIMILDVKSGQVKTVDRNCED